MILPLPTSPVVAVDIDEQGRRVAPVPGNNSPLAWTGTSIGGDKTADTCSDWSSVAQDVSGQGGDADAADNAIWTDYGSTPCDHYGHLYCLQQ